ncbi:electron transfer flavoprotein subunit beta/FixA family protein [Syntrophomonas wolfei]|jgi:electron transfer flavoprotein beta subunit|uniref:electron transfer flavoprotein subunit beta/FixA family protein n=1 Tax=Syntrophomonas wolfei TaxID=863 RepID=UPI0023F0C3D6|nr:electron transfer flavoprotein subunit beta/FixA family protein [Syntrophomonas wolfei]
MNVVVAMKQIPDLQQIRIRNRQPVLEDVPWTMGAIDKNALEAAVQIKEAQGGKVVLLSAGNEELEDTAKEALAAGADEALLIIDDELDEMGSAEIARILAAAIQRIEKVDLIIFGEGSGDNYSGQVGSRVAEILGLPQVGYASAIEVQGESLRVSRSLEDGEELVEVGLPAVITVISGINEPRIASVTQILKAGKKPKEILDLSDLVLDLGDICPVKTESNLAPESDRKRVAVKSVDELVAALKGENLIGR